MTAIPDPDGAPGWVLCTGCMMPLYGKRLERDLGVCAHCGAHHALTAHQRLAQLADGGHYTPLDPVAVPDDPLGFVDTLPYGVRLDRARRRTGLDEAVVCARLAVDGIEAVVAVMDFRFLGGSLSVAVGAALTQAADVALAERRPFVVVTASGGARMQEGALALMQMATTAAALGRLDEAGLMTVSVVTDPTYGGVAASFATLADVIVAEPGARLGFAGRRVIEQTIRQELPPGFQTVETLVDQGFVDRVVPRSRLVAELGDLLRAGARHPAPTTGMSKTGMSTTGPLPASEVVRDPDALATPVPWRTVQAARDLARPTTLDYLAMAFEGFRELRGDRVAGDCSAVVGGIARLAGRPVVVIGHQKGHEPAELVRRNFGMPRPPGYRKAARLLRLAGKLGLPVVTLVDTPGAHPGRDAEEQGQAVAIAECLRTMAGLGVPVVSVVVGEGGSGGALALAVADRVLMFSNAVYSVISPEGCASIIWRDPARAPEAAGALALTAPDLLRSGVADGVIPEPPGGTGAAPQAAADALAAAVADEIDALSGLAPGALVAGRRRRFQRVGRSAPALAPAPAPTAGGG